MEFLLLSKASLGKFLILFALIIIFGVTAAAVGYRRLADIEEKIRKQEDEFINHRDLQSLVGLAQRANW